MNKNKQELGYNSEILARKKLVSCGYKIIEKNFSCKLGEIDIIAQDGDTLVFVEVRSRKNCDYGLPQETINYKKQQKLRKLAQYYLKLKNCVDISCRFDVVAIFYEPEEQVEIIKNAF